MTPAEAIAAALEARGVTTQKAAAEVLGVSPQLWSLWVRGDKDMQARSIQRALYAAFASGYDVRLEWRADGVRGVVI